MTVLLLFLLSAIVLSVALGRAGYRAPPARPGVRAASWWPGHWAEDSR